MVCFKKFLNGGDLISEHEKKKKDADDNFNINFQKKRILFLTF